MVAGRRRGRWTPAALVLALAVGAPVSVAARPASGAPSAPTDGICVPGAKPIMGLRTTDKVVTFTFDDGPSSTHTRAVMTAFEARGLRATFFVVSRGAQRNPTLVQETVARGHELGNHSRTHTYSGARNIAEMPKAQSDLEQYAGVRPIFYRAPGLAWSKGIVRATGTNGLCAIDSNGIIGDWIAPRMSAAKLCSRFVKMLKPGSLVVLHDGGNSHRQTVDALPCMLDHALAQGYQVLPLREFLALAGGDPAKLIQRK